ncbi:hypothetical protein B1748_22860 [Paenibacillus sp. MY03]|uniref:FAD-dependent oxidoreductase n=1 Tax=Paenibacillus sp. MY03 TaxID=302980 RepID=UPI000B3BE2C0|nr:FAD-dependent oxidoreductase [Paenibacillus sp. MY03]OUS73312.1 hypothetical protein B1748_22860 [Paenibacillus sp. MY03]
MATLHHYEIVVIGAGVGGICAALAAGRLRRRVLLIDCGKEAGGTGVHTSVSLVCKFRGTDGTVINNGIHRELFPQAYAVGRGLFGEEDDVPTYDEQELKAAYQKLLEREPYVTVWTDSEATEVFTEQRVNASGEKSRRILGVEVVKGKQLRIRVTGDQFLDATADGNLSAMAGADFQLGREQDGKMQTATVTFKMSGFRTSLLQNPNVRTWRGIHALRRELTGYYEQMKALGQTNNPRPSVLCFPYPDGQSLLFNSTAVTDVDPTNQESVDRGMAEGVRQATELIEAVKRHPAFADATVDFIAPKLGIREGRRVVGEYMLTADDCLTARTFDDMVAACAYSLDIHDPLGGASKLTPIQEPGYYHIPYRSLIAKGWDNLLLSSRCISGSHEAHSSYRIMSGVSAIGEAAGTAAALALWLQKEDVREVSAARIRYVLHTAGQFVEGNVEKVTLG